MSFATRCTACGTIFRVVQDQLKVSDGWVRCGRCDAVFDAASGLFDLEHDAPPEWQPAAPPEPVDAEPTVPTPTPADARPFQSEDERRWSESMAAQGLTAEPETQAVVGASVAQPPVHGMPPMAAEPQTGPAARSEPVGEELLYGHSRGNDREEDDDTIVITDHPSSLRASSLAPVDPPSEVRSDNGEEPLVAEAPPGFLRESRRDRPRQSGRAAVLLCALAVVLLVALALQAAQQYSELAAARWPALRPVLTAWCGLSRCSVGPPHRIDDIVVESTGLSPVPTAPDTDTGASAGAGAGAGAETAGPSALRLAVTLRNRAAYAVALPAIDLSLTDTSGKLIARRTLLPADFQVLAASVPSAADLPLQALFKTDGGSARVSGYTVEIFYP